MVTNKQVFGSSSERGNYYKLSRQWGSSYRIYHNLPFLNVFNTKGLLYAKKLSSMESLFDPNESDKLGLADTDYSRLKKPSGFFLTWKQCGLANRLRSVACRDHDAHGGFDS